MTRTDENVQGSATSEAPSYSGAERRWAPSYLRVGGIELPYVTRERAIQAVDRSFEDRRPIRVAFCNANTMLRALDSREYARALSRFLVLNDGVGVNICSRIFNGRPFPANLNGTDFVPGLLEESRHDLRIYLFGAKPGVAAAAADALEQRFPRHEIVGVRNGYFSEAEVDGIIEQINAARPDIVLVALGNPLQEQFVAAHGERIEAPAVVMVGALLDFMAGAVVRAPRLVQALRAEWLFRLVQEPRRLGRRYTLDVARFLVKIVRLRMTAASEDLSSAAARRLRPEN